LLLAWPLLGQAKLRINLIRLTLESPGRVLAFV
jgi:hypothetical protein